MEYLSLLACQNVTVYSPLPFLQTWSHLNLYELIKKKNLY